MPAYTDTELQSIARTPARLAPPVWLPQRQIGREIHGPGGEAFKLPAPRPVPAGRQPHVAAMRFIDCLFNRCRAPLDLTLEEDPESDAPGGRPALDMLCCGLCTRPLKSYCAYHAALLRQRRLCPVPIRFLMSRLSSRSCLPPQCCGLI